MTTLPQSTDSLIFWMDPAEKFVTKNSSSKVSAVFNRVDGRIMTQPTISKQPTWSNTAVNGLPGLIFSGAQSMKYNYVGQLLTNRQPFILTQILKNVTAPGYSAILASDSDVTSFSAITVSVGSIYGEYSDESTAFYNYTDSSNTIGTGTNIFTFIFDGSAIHGRMNQRTLSVTQTGTDVPGNTIFTRFNIGGYTDTTNQDVSNITATIGETIIYKGSSCFKIIEDYLKEKYSLRF